MLVESEVNEERQSLSMVGGGGKGHFSVCSEPCRSGQKATPM